VAGTDVTRTCAPGQPVSVLQVHAMDDDHVLFNGGAGPAAVRDRSKITHYLSVPDTVARWVGRNRCEPRVVRAMERPGARCDVYAACAEGAKVQLCTTDDGGHSWPGAAATRWSKGAASQALSANDVIWDFFQATGR
jgi:polyhydroxybutyrate depolymerase